MFRFNSRRSEVLFSLERVRGGILKIDTLYGVPVELPMNRVRFTTTRTVSDPTVRLVDFGELKKGQKPTSAVIAAATRDSLPVI